MPDDDAYRKVAVQTTLDYYDRAFSEFGPTARGVDWSEEDGQEARFLALDGIFESMDAGSVCDFGCGYGAYASHLLARRFGGVYVGVDLSERMIQHAREVQYDPARFTFAVGQAPEPADYVVASGIFNVMTAGTRAAWAEHAWDLIGQMIEAASVGIAFNMLLEPTAPYRDRPELFWQRPPDVEASLRSLGCDVQVVGGYGLHEVTYLAWIT